MSKTILEAIDIAAALVGPGTINPEYERAQAELIADLFPDEGIDKDVHKSAIQRAIYAHSLLHAYKDLDSLSDD